MAEPDQGLRGHGSMVGEDLAVLRPGVTEAIKSIQHGFGHVGSLQPRVELRSRPRPRASSSRLHDRFGGKAVIVGFSFGATFAAYATTQRPDLVHALVAGPVSSSVPELG